MSRIFPGHSRRFLQDVLDECEGNVIRAIDKVLNGRVGLARPKPTPPVTAAVVTSSTQAAMAARSAFTPASVMGPGARAGFLPLPAYPANFIPNVGPPTAVMRPEYAAAMAAAAAMNAYTTAGVTGAAVAGGVSVPGVPINLSGLPMARHRHAHHHHHHHNAAATFAYCDEVKRMASSMKDD